LGAKNNRSHCCSPLAAFVALLLLAQAVATRPELIDGIGVRVLGWVNSARGHATRDRSGGSGGKTLDQLESVSLNRRELAVAFSWSFFNWVGRRRVPGLRRLRRRGQAVSGRPDRRLRGCSRVGSIPLMPGGLLVVEAVLVPGLVSSGMTLPDAISAMLIYRLVSWIFHLRDRLGGVLLHVPHRRSPGPGRRRRRTRGRRSAERPNRRRRPLRHRFAGARCRHPIQRPGPTTITDVSQRCL